MTTLTNPRPIKAKNKDAHTDRYRTSCTDCRYGIFEGMETVWTKRGLVHLECENKRLQGEFKGT